MDDKPKQILSDSISRRLALSGFTEKAQADAWFMAVEAILNNKEEEVTKKLPAKEQANFRQMLMIARRAFSLEIKAYQKYISDKRSSTSAADAAMRMQTRLEHQQQPVSFV